MATSEDIYLKYPAGRVLRAETLEDINAGMYPCYYTVVDDQVWVSSSVTELIHELGEFEINTEFNPPDYVKMGKGSRTKYDYITGLVPKQVKNSIPPHIQEKIQQNLDYESPYFSGRKTVDVRVSRLLPFEKISYENRTSEFKLSSETLTADDLIKHSSKYITEYINRIEREYPDHHHIILMGGKDSQIIGLVPKVSGNWSVFSAEPNYSLVTKFIEDNNLTFSNIYKHRNTNEESEEDLIRKLICSDLRADPRHIRWRYRLKEIAEKYNNKCIFWAGTGADAIFSYYSSFHKKDREEYLKSHFTRVANWQGITHQTTKNFTGSPMISPYHSERFWNKIMRRYDPSIFTKNTDLRNELGKEIFGGSVDWPESNPGPEPYSYEISLDGFDAYQEYIRDYLSGNRESAINHNL